MNLIQERKFLFIDETGDPGHPTQRDSSKYFQINMISTSRSNIKLILRHFYRFRYFANAHKELKRYYQKETKQLLIDLIRASIPHASFYAFYVDKQTYLSNRLARFQAIEDFDPKKFRNLILKEALERWSEIELNRKDFGGYLELVIDRFIDNEAEELDLKSYLRNNYNLPPFFHITQIDSDCSEIIQITDLVGKMVKDHLAGITHVPEGLIHLSRLDE